MTKRSRRINPATRRLKYSLRKAAVVVLVAGVFAIMVAADRFGVFGLPAGPDRDVYHGKTFRVARVIDGDTIDIDIPDGKHDTTRIRLWGVDTPETVKPDHPVEHFGPEASKFTRRMCEGKQVRIELEPSGPTRGNHGRLLAWVYLPDGSLLNRKLVAEGLAYADPRFFDHHLKRELLDLQGRVRKERKGLWKDVQPAQLPSYLSKSRPR